MAEDYILLNCNEISDTAHDASLIGRAKQGDGRAFELLISPYLSKLFNTIIRITKNREDAEDCLQETLIRAFTRIDQFKGASRFSTWLLSIGVNQALMHLRSRKRGILFLDSGDNDSLPALDPADTRPNPELQCLAAELSTTIERLIRGLPHTFQPAFEMRYLRELSNEEAAAALDLSTPTIKTRAFRARRQLRERLSRQYGLMKNG